MDFKKNAETYLRSFIKEKMNHGSSAEEAVYMLKRELAKVTKPLAADGDIRKAVDAMQKAERCTLDTALTKLKLFAYNHDWI